MKILAPAALVALLVALVGAVALTPELVFGRDDGAMPAALGHTAAHDAPQLACGPSAEPVKRFQLRAEPAPWTFTAGGAVDGWTFNGTVPGPLLCANLGDTVEVTVENRLDVPVLFHTHLPTNDTTAAAPGTTRTYAFRATTAGTFVYHDLASGHAGTARGLAGVLLVRNGTPDVDHEIVMVLGEVNPEVHPGSYAATVNGLSFPHVPHYVFERGERVLVHLVNLGPGEEHTLHIHGHRWHDAADARPIDNKFLSPHTAVAHPEIPLPAGVVSMTHALAEESADFLFLAETEGEWMYHCHVYDHINAGMTGMLTVVAPGAEAPHHA